MRGYFLLYGFPVFQNWGGEHSRCVKANRMFVAAFWAHLRLFSRPGWAPQIPKELANHSFLRLVAVFSSGEKVLKNENKTQKTISVLILQIKILMMRILWMVIGLLPPALRHPKLQQAPAETLAWGPPAGSAHPLSDPSLQVGPSPVWYCGVSSAGV